GNRLLASPPAPVGANQSPSLFLLTLAFCLVFKELLHTLLSIYAALCIVNLFILLFNNDVL
ncbi:hypothetical protein, partial [Parageobacillus thermoglucosidasius]